MRRSVPLRGQGQSDRVHEDHREYRLPKGRKWLLVARLAAARESSSLLARLLVVRVLLQLAEKSALLKLHVEALEGAVDGFVRLYSYVNQAVFIASAKLYYGSKPAKAAQRGRIG